MRKSILLSFFAGWALAQVQDHSGSVVGTEMWDSSVVHRITADLLVEPGAHLILQQGTIVKLDSGVSVIVAGDLTANGTWSNQVFFTSILDDSQGGDSDGDPYALPAPGDWGSIIFLPGANASGLSGFHEVTVSYGGRTEACLILNCFLEPRSTISFSGSDGIWLNSCGENCDPRLWVRVFDCVGNGLVMNSEGGLILGGAFVGNEMGIVFLHGGPKTKNWPYVAENRSHGLFVDGGLPNITEIESSNNGGYGFFFNRSNDVTYWFEWHAT